MVPESPILFKSKRRKSARDHENNLAPGTMRVHDALMAPASFGEVLAGNIRAARSRANLDQAVVVARMKALGFTTWHRQTLGKVERNERRVTGEELFGLALSLEVSVPTLTTAADYRDGYIELPNGYRIGAISIERLAGRGVNDHAVQWPDGGTTPWIGALHPTPGADPFDRDVMGPAMAAQGWPGAEVPSREQAAPAQRGEPGDG
jgi:transcriptional regulator with XRE-family HTH domain